jgi:broad specificity phosphatase PhoE
MDSPLTQKGRSQAMVVGKCLAELLGPEVQATLMVSPLGRARETAALLAAARSYHAVVLESRIREVSLGAWDGLSHEEIDAEWPNALDGATAFDWHLRAPDCEPYEAAFARSQDWLSGLAGTVVAVSHGLIGRIIRAAYLGLRLDELVCLDASPERIWHLSRGSAASIDAREAMR